MRLVCVALLIGVSLGPYSAALSGQERSCAPTGAIARLPGLPEASGIALSRRSPDRLWAHNDSGPPVLYALDGRGAVAGQVRLTGAAVDDWEAIAAGPCGSASCLYVGDIGDNLARRARITVYRVPEPDAPGGTAAVSGVFHATYPDGAQDAETLLVAPDGRLFIVTKGETGPLGVYRFPATLVEGAAMRLERVGGAGAKPGARSRITDGSVSADGQWVVLRSGSELTFFQAARFLAGSWSPIVSIDLRPLKEPQGEGVAVGNGTVYLAGEGGGRQGTFARFPCLPR